MKKGICLTLIILMIAGVLHITVSRHFCDGILVASKISLSGSQADCGMKSPQCKSPYSGSKIDIHCCTNVANSLELAGFYFPSFSAISEYYLDIIYYLYNPSDYQLFASTDTVSGRSNHDPPAAELSPSVRLPMICVFRV